MYRPVTMHPRARGCTAQSPVWEHVFLCNAPGPEHGWDEDLEDGQALGGDEVVGVGLAVPAVLGDLDVQQLDGRGREGKGEGTGLAQCTCREGQGKKIAHTLFIIIIIIKRRSGINPIPPTVIDRD